MLADSLEKKMWGQHLVLPSVSWGLAPLTRYWFLSMKALLWATLDQLDLSFLGRRLGGQLVLKIRELLPSVLSLVSWLVVLWVVFDWLDSNFLAHYLVDLLVQMFVERVPLDLLSVT